MATGGVTLTEDDLSCDICFNLYHNPKTLKCLHTYCGGCISQLAGHRRTVECPNCRGKNNMADIRKDFRIQKLLDQHLGQVTGTFTCSGNTCGMCKKKWKSIQMYCADCDKLLCPMCCRIHAETKDIANHTIILKTDLIKHYKSELQSKLDLLQKGEKEISININNLDSDISRIQKEQQNLLKKVDREIDKAVHQLNKTRLELHKKIKDSDKTMIEILVKSKSKCKKEKTDICTDITQVRGVIDKDDVFMLKNVNSLLNVPLPIPTVPIQINLDTIPSLKVVPGSWRPDDIVKVVPGAWGPDDIVKVVPVCDVIPGCSSVTNKVSVDDHKLPDFSVVRNNEYVQCKTLNSNIHRIQIIHKNLYCAGGHKGIQVYDKNCDFIRSITSDNFGFVTGVADCGTGDIILLTDAIEYIQGGLHQVTLQGIYVRHVTEGDFTDVCVYNGTVYGLTGSEIQLFQMKSSEWVKVGKIDLKTMYTGNSMCINNDGIFISMCKPYSSIDTIFVYNHETRSIQKLGGQPQSNWDPRVCSVDSHSNVLVVDSDNKTVCMFFKDESKWHDFLTVRNCLGTCEFITDAIVDERGDNIWVATNKRLIKYTKKQQ